MSNPNRRVETAELEAARWHARLGESRVSADTVTAFFSWRKDPVNAEAYQRVEQAWSKAGDLRGRPHVEAALASAMTRQARARPSARTYGWSGAVLALLVGGCGLVFWLQGQGRTAYETAVGEQRVVELSDGSTVRLDTDTEIRVLYSAPSAPAVGRLRSAVASSGIAGVRLPSTVRISRSPAPAHPSSGETSALRRRCRGSCPRRGRRPAGRGHQRSAADARAVVGVAPDHGAREIAGPLGSGGAPEPQPRLRTSGQRRWAVENAGSTPRPKRRLQAP